MWPLETTETKGEAMNNTYNLFGKMFYHAMTTTDHDPSNDVVAVFKDGRKATYTTAIIHLLKTDPAIEYVYDAMTGEIL